MDTTVERITRRLVSSECRPETAAYRQLTVEKAIVAMQATITRPLSLQLICRAVLVSHSQLDHIFRAATGISPRKYMSALRLAYAKRLLINTDLKIIDICMEAGYSSLGTFSRSFAASVGVSPQDLRGFLQSSELKQIHTLDPARINSQTLKDGVQGRLVAPAGFSGIAFVGLFPTPIPQGNPIRCIILNGPGEFRIDKVPDGNYYAFAIGFEHGGGPLSYLQNDDAMRAPSRPLAVRVSGGRSEPRIQLELRYRKLSDPPVLLAIPALLPRIGRKRYP